MVWSLPEICKEMSDTQVPSIDELLQSEKKLITQSEQQLFKCVLHDDCNDAREALLDKVRHEAKIEAFEECREWLGAWQVSLMGEPKLPELDTNPILKEIAKILDGVNRGETTRMEAIRMISRAIEED